MDLTWLLDLAGEAEATALLGLLIGAIFGFSAQRSRFCLRAAVAEFADFKLGPRMAVWLLTFATALTWTHALALADLLSLEETRFLAQPGTFSGAMLGGAIFGAGMILARGCSGRLLVLAATGNLRALLSGLVFAVVAQMTLRGVLAPVRTDLSALSVSEAPVPELGSFLPGGDYVGLILGILFTIAALALAWRNRVGPRLLVFGSAVGFAVAAGWAATYALSQSAFDPVPLKSLTFSGPTADMLMFFLLPDGGLDFDIGLIPGVALGAFVAAALSRELKWQGWSGAGSMHRYLIGAALMGFGAMLAGGCAIGAGVTGGSTLALTMWLALLAMWAGGMATHWIIDGPERAAAGEPVIMHK